MSSKNKIGNKLIRRRSRLLGKRAASAVAERTPVSPIAQKTSARLLSNPKQKMTGNTRRRLQRSRGMVLDNGSFVLSGGTGLAPEVKVALKLEALPLVKLIRRLKQAARRAATCLYLLRDIDPLSKFVAGLKAEQTHQLSLCRQISAEITVRNHNTQH